MIFLARTHLFCKFGTKCINIPINYNQNCKKMKRLKNLFFVVGLLFATLSARGQLEFTFSGLTGVKQTRLTDGTLLVQLPAGTDLSKMSTYGMSAKIAGTSVALSDIVPDPSTQTYTDGGLNSFYYKGQNFQVRFSAGEYFTAVMFTDASIGSTSSRVTAEELAAYAQRIAGMGKEGGRHFSFEALPGYTPKADIAFYLGDMTSTNSPSPIVHTVDKYFNVTKKCAVVTGQFESFGNNATVTEYGLCYSTSANPTVTANTYKKAVDYATEDATFGTQLEGVFGVYFDNLTASTTYHVRAYCTYTMNGTTSTVYGEDKEFTTTAGSGFTWAWEGGETPSAEVKARIEEAMNGAKEYYTDYCNLYKWCGTSYHSGVQTADCSLRSDGSCYIRFGPGERYQWVGTAQHEISHGYGVGQTSAWAGYSNPLNFPTATLTLRVFLQDMTMLISHDSMHYWPGGINQREEVTNGTSNNKGTYTCKNEEMLKCNAMILNGMSKDGMKTTYGVKEENGELEWDNLTAGNDATSGRRKVTTSSGGSAFENALDAFNQAGIPLLVSTGELDQAHGTTGASASGYALNREAYAVVTRSLVEAQTHGIENVNRFDNLTSASTTVRNNSIQPQPYTFTFKGVRFYNGLKQWFDKPMYKYSNSSYRYLTPDDLISNLSTFVNSHSTETSIWLQHVPFAAEDYVWLDKTAANDANGTVYRASNGTTSYTASNTTYNKYYTATNRRNGLGNLIKKTANATMFSGHTGSYNENSTTYGFKDYTVEAMGNTPGDALIVLMKAGTGVVEVQRVDFRDYGPLVVRTEDEPADKPTETTNPQNVVLGGLVEAIENLGADDATLNAALATARNAKTATAVNAAIGTLNSAFATYAGSGLADVSALLGGNTDFETAQGERISTLIGDDVQGLFAIPGWTENHSTNQTAWAFCQYKTDQGSPVSGNSLYLRENWKGSPAQPSTIQVYKDAVLPSGSFRLTFYMRQAGQNYTEALNYYELNGVRTDLSAGNNWESKSIDIDVETPSVFRLSFGFRGSTSEGNVPCQVDVDQITLYWLPSEEIETLDGTYYLYNPSTQLFLGAGNSWGTQASLLETGIDFKLASSGVGYTLDSDISNGGNSHFLGSNLFLDSGSAVWNIAETGTEGGKKTYTLSIDNTNFLAAPASGNVVTTVQNSTVPATQWQLLTRDDLIARMASATESAPVNATFLLPGYHFSRNDARNSTWTNSGDWTDHGGDVTNLVVEYWNRNFDIYQTLTNIPDGIYQLSAQGYYRNGGYTEAANSRSSGSETLNAFIYANDQTLALPSIFDAAGRNGTTGVETALGYIPNSIGDASSYLSASLYPSETLRVTVEGGTLRVGAKKETLVGNDWTVIDNFRLLYLGDGKSTPGDVNRDGSVTIADVTDLVNIILGKDSGPTPVYDHAAADVNQDSNVTIADVTALVNQILGKSGN